jgi:hypothetical protein
VRYPSLSVLLLLMTMAAGCASPLVVQGGIPPTAPLPTTQPPGLASPTPTPRPTAVPLSFTSATYKDEANGFELDYPADWSSSPNAQIGSRGSQAQLFSPGASAEALPEGATRIGITIYQWDPNNDLASYVTHRKTAWEASLSTIAVEHEGDLVDGRKEMDFIVKGPDGAQAFVLFTTLGERYLEISGEGDLGLVQEVARTLRPVNFAP